MEILSVGLNICIWASVRAFFLKDGSVHLKKATKAVFRSPKTAEDESNLLKESISEVNSLQKTNGQSKFFREWKASRKVQRPVLDPGGAFKDYSELHKVQPLSTDLESMDACSLKLLAQQICPRGFEC